MSARLAIGVSASLKLNAMSKTLSEPVAALDGEAQSKFDSFLKKSEVARKGARAGNEAKALKEEIVLLMGDRLIAQLPDGRRIQKVQKSGHRNPMPASDYSWWELAEMPAAA